MHPLVNTGLGLATSMMSRGLVGGIGRQKTRTKSRIRAKAKKVQNWRMHNKMARRSRRINRIRMKGK
jgi:hypothetical protein